MPGTTEIFVTEWSVQAAVHTVVYWVLSESQTLLTPHDSVNTCSSAPHFRRITGTVSTLCMISSFSGRCISCVNSPLISNLRLLTTLSLMMVPSTLVFSQFLMQLYWILWLFPGGAMAGAWRSSLTPTNVKNEYSCTSTLPLRLHGMLQREFYLNTMRPVKFPPCKMKVRLLPTGRTY